MLIFYLKIFKISSFGNFVTFGTLNNQWKMNIRFYTAQKNGWLVETNPAFVKVSILCLNFCDSGFSAKINNHS